MSWEVLAQRALRPGLGGLEVRGAGPDHLVTAGADADQADRDPACSAIAAR